MANTVGDSARSLISTIRGTLRDDMPITKDLLAYVEENITNSGSLAVNSDVAALRLVIAVQQLEYRLATVERRLDE